MKRIKTRWDFEFPESRKTAQNLVDNAKRFKKQGWGNKREQEELIVERATPENNSKQLNWTTERKSKRKRFYEEGKGKMGPKVSRIPTSKLAETKR